LAVTVNLDFSTSNSSEVNTSDGDVVFGGGLIAIGKAIR
jgi:hypothetical protein